MTVAGGNGAGPGANQLDAPQAVAVDGPGNVYVADTANDRVQRWAPGASSGTTIAGGNGWGSGASQLRTPFGLAVDGSGNVFIADTWNHRVQRWAPGASVGVTVAGGNGAGSGTAQLAAPHGVALSAAGDVIVADTYNQRITLWEPGATAGETVLGNVQGSGASQFDFPRSVATTPDGYIIVADTGNARVQRTARYFSSASTIAGGAGAGPASTQLDGPAGVAVDATGDVYVADTTNHRVQRVALRVRTVAGSGFSGSTADRLNVPSGIAIDGSGNVYVADTANHRIQRWAPGAGSGVTVAGGNGAGPDSDQLSSPEAVAVDAFGNVFVADTGNERVVQWAYGATVGTVFVDRADASAIWGTHSPAGIAIESDGDVLVAERTWNRVKRYGPGDPVDLNGHRRGTIVAGAPSGVDVWTGAQSAADRLDAPRGIALDAAGNLYIADENNHRVQRWAPGATVGVTVAGGHGAGSGANQLDSPRGVAVDAAGFVFVADRLNNRIQRWAPGAAEGVTVAGGGSDGTGAIGFPRDVELDAAGNVLVSDTQYSRVQRWDFRSQGISFGALPDAASTTAPFAIVVSASSGLPVAVASLTPGVCAVAGTTVTLTGEVGTCTLRATQGGDLERAGATADASFAVKLSNVISFGTLPPRKAADPAFVLTASASSGLPVAFSSLTPSVCTVTGSSVSMTELGGPCTIRAEQSGNAGVIAAVPVDRSFIVTHDVVLRVGDVALGEGSVSALTVQVVIAASSAFSEPLCVWWRTSDVTATGVDRPTLFDGTQDYMRMGVSKPRFALLAANRTVAKTAVKVNYDGIIEADETFRIIIDKVTAQVAGRCDASASADARIKVTRSIGTVTILDDDIPE
ncbi:MAG: NHL repeat-containing protein [Actinomycetes bacterium]